ncbi:MAG: ABC-2 family transporter protein [Candidatus Kerfeldbacteria bacterium]|nr:ABC-2 family transporter protein [Candidatus Kerfeldbacteria bacterium]
MRKYWAIAAATWQEYVTYRLNLFLEVFGGVLLMLATIALWRTVYITNGNAMVGTFTLAEMVTYLLVAGVINSFIWLTAQGDEINDDINQGRLSVWLHRPVSALGYWFTRDIIRKVMTLLLGGSIFVIVLVAYRSFLVLPSSGSIILFLAALLIAGALHFLLFTLFSIIAFWFEQTWGERFLLRVVMEIAAGALIPLSLFPTFWQTVFAWLPFRFLIAFPAELFLGKVDAAGILTGFAGAAGWVAAVGVATAFVWRRGLARYTAEGG